MGCCLVPVWVAVAVVGAVRVGVGVGVGVVNVGRGAGACGRGAVRVEVAAGVRVQGRDLEGCARLGVPQLQADEQGIGEAKVWRERGGGIGCLKGGGRGESATNKTKYGSNLGVHEEEGQR